jgi:hypothetical protein
VQKPLLRDVLSMTAAASVIRTLVPNRLRVWLTQSFMANQGRCRNERYATVFPAPVTPLTGRRPSSRPRQQLHTAVPRMVPSTDAGRATAGDIQ